MVDSASVFWNGANAADFDQRTLQSGRLSAIKRVAAMASSHLTPRSTSVDLGCGTGLLAECARQTSIIGVDFSEGLATLARRRMQTVIVGDALNPPFEERSVDNVFSLFVLDDYPDAIKISFIRRVSAILKTKGRFFLAAYSPADERMGSLCRSINARLNQSFDIHLRPIEFYREHLCASGFRVEHSKLHRCRGTYATPEGDVSVQREFILLSAVQATTVD